MVVRIQGESEMRRSFLAIGCLLAAALSSPARAGIFGDDLGRCAVNATSQADRTALLRWMFITAAANPALADLSSVSSQTRERSFRAAAAVFNRILLDACRRQAVAALRNEGAEGLQTGFQALGLIAGREMMMTPAGAASLDQLGAYMDANGLAALGVEAGVGNPPRR